MPFSIIRNDITKVTADAIVNTANPFPVCGRGTDLAIYEAAGKAELLKEREKIGEIRVGETAVTPAFRLHAKYIIHTVGPVWKGGTDGELEKLASCYRKSMLIAKQLGCESIAFPLISTGVYGFPKDRALDTALKTIKEFLGHSEMNVTLVVFNKEAFDLSSSLAEDVRQYIDDKYVQQQKVREYGHDLSEAAAERRRELFQRRRHADSRREASLENHTVGHDRTENIWEEALTEDRLYKEEEELHTFSFALPEEDQRPYAPLAGSAAVPGMADREGSAVSGKKRAPAKKNLSEIMKHIGESFQECLFRLIDESGMTDAEVYKKANIDRKLFSKIRCNPDYTPGKRTILALAIALELNMDETVDLLKRAGLALSPGNKADLIALYCIENEIYDIFEINALLFEYDQPMLGC